MKIPVFLVCRLVQDRSGAVVEFRERRLIRQSESDKIIAIVEAPEGSRIRSRGDEHGREQLLVPVRSTWWARLLGRMTTIPAKYVIGCARTRAHGLALVSSTPEAATPSCHLNPSAPERAC
jgi:hypothetical protein